jgi:hypothetical protein
MHASSPVSNPALSADFRKVSRPPERPAVRFRFSAISRRRKRAAWPLTLVETHYDEVRFNVVGCAIHFN